MRLDVLISRRADGSVVRQQSARNRRYERRRTSKNLPVKFLGDYHITEESRGGFVRSFGPGAIIKASDRDYLVTLAGNFLRGSFGNGEFHRWPRERNKNRRAAQ